jgi:hypothetical protein
MRRFKGDNHVTADKVASNSAEKDLPTRTGGMGRKREAGWRI